MPEKIEPVTQVPYNPNALSKSKIIKIIIWILFFASAIILTIFTSLKLNKYTETLNEKAKTENIDTNSYKGINYFAYAGIGSILLLIVLLLLAYILNITYNETYKNNEDFINGLIIIIFVITIFINTANISFRREMKYGSGYNKTYVKHLKDIDDKFVEILEYTSLSLLIISIIVTFYL